MIDRGHEQNGLRAVPLPPRRGLSRLEAAEYVGVGETLFDRMVRDRRMPLAKRIGHRLVWDRLALDAAFAALPDTAGAVSVAPADEPEDLAEIEFAP